jgi:carboxyl-terminal processing protease
VAHIKISSFQKTTAADVESALRRLDAAGMRSLVIDLRGNPGGLLSAAVDVADLFLERGLVVATRGRSPEEDFNYTASRPGTWRMPLVIVIDGESASSSEIFAGAIRDHGRGTIVGTRSYGKGSILGMRLTTAKFYSPNGHPYSGVGVEPHLAVHAAAKPVDGQVSATPADAFIGTALEVARRSVVQSPARSTVQPAGRGGPRPLPRPQPRSTASR